MLSYEARSRRNRVEEDISIEEDTLPLQFLFCEGEKIHFRPPYGYWIFLRLCSPRNFSFHSDDVKPFRKSTRYFKRGWERILGGRRFILDRDVMCRGVDDDNRRIIDQSPWTHRHVDTISIDRERGIIRGKTKWLIIPHPSCTPTLVIEIAGVADNVAFN